MSSNNTVIKLGFNHDWKVLSHALKSDPAFEVEEIATANEAATFLSTVNSALIFISLGKKDDLIQAASLVKIYKKVAPDTAVKFAIINFSGDRSYEKAIAKLGIQDIIDPNINTKALRFKVDFWMKGINAQLKKNEAALAMKAAASKGGPETAKTTSNSQDAINWAAPMDCVDDFWLIKNEGDCKRVLGKWLIRVTGPGPYVGQWNEVNGRNNLWRFEFRKEERENFHDADGSWFFRGDQKPDFQWKDNIWMITGSQFDLYYQDSKSIVSRLSLVNKALTVCKNSEYARTKETMVFGSFDKEIVLKRNGNIQTNEQLDTEGGADRLKNLEGKGKTDKTSSGPLSGKTKGTDDMTSGLLAMDLEPGQNKLDGGPLSLENKNNEHKKHWKGHNEVDKYDAADLSAPASGEVRKGAFLDLENKSNEHKAHWKGHNEAEAYEGGEYGGKSDTDKLKKYYDNGENAGAKGEEDKKKPDFETEMSDLARERELKRQKKEAIEAKERASRERDDKEKREKSQKEDQEFDSNQKELKKSKEITHALEERKGPLGGKGQTDKLKSHYSGPDCSADEEGEDVADASGESPFRARKNLNRKESESRVRTPVAKKGTNKNDDGSGPDEDIFAEESEKEENLASLEEARKLKELQNVLSEQDDPGLEMVTQTAEINSFLILNDEKVNCRLDDFFDQTIIFAIDDKKITDQSEVKLDLSFNYLKKVAKLNFDGKIIETMDDGEGNKYLTVQIPEGSVKALDAFMKLYQIRQKNINFFLKKVRGL